MNINDIKWVDTVLVPLTTLGEQNKSISGVISVGEPFACNAVKLANIGGPTLDPEIQLMLDKFLFVYVRIPISIRGKEFDVRFVGLDIDLGAEANQINCWSMQPLRVEQEIKVKTTSGINSKIDLKLIGIGGQESASGEVVVYQPTITAFGIGEAVPGWEFTPTEGRELNGVQLLHLVVKMRKGLHSKAKIKMKADLYRDGLLWNYCVLSRNNEETVQQVELPGFLA